MRFTIILFLCSLFIFEAFSQQAVEKKQATAVWTNQLLEIDGVLNEEIWSQAQWLDEFVQTEPYNGREASFDTKVAILFDDNALYIGAQILDPEPDKISLELRGRDLIGEADFFGLQLDPFNDGLNAFAFIVTARGVQIDNKVNSWDEEDHSWDAVWKSSVTIGEQGWFAEIMIPYAALRFPRKDVQNWGINFFRSIQRNREYSSWNFIDANIRGGLQQAGLLQLGSKIEPPLRISATPYLAASTAHNSQSGNWNQAYNAGLDLKVGLSESFTLDMTLVPDFGQVASDDRIFSLSPFEVFYEERRPFFTEGTELFSKGGVFYSRRIGGTPAAYSSIQNNYEADQIIENPDQVQLINAMKLSGKTKNGLAIGLFNAITDNTYASILLDDANETKELTEPLTNYNMLVIEQSLRNNSQISFYNTNVLPKEGNIANVSGTEMAIRNKSQKIEFYGMFNLSQQYESGNETDIGSRLLFSAEAISGKLRPDIWVNIMTDNYDPNAMGFQRSNNEIGQGINVKYFEFEPKGNILKWYARLYAGHYYLYNPRKFMFVNFGGDARFTFRNHLTVGGSFNLLPLGKRDYFETRVSGRYVKVPESITASFWGSPDYRKRFLVDYRLGMSYTLDYKRFNPWIRLTPRWRLQDNFMIIPSLEIDFTRNDHGYVMDSVNTQSNALHTIIFGKRNLQNVTSSITADYIFSPDISLAFRLRHYWLAVAYQEFFDLIPDGSLIGTNYQNPEDFIVNSFNVDLVLKWNFAPGSELLLIWKNAVYEQQKGEGLPENYFANLESLSALPVSNSFNIKLLYYLDWQQIKHYTKRN